MSKTVRRKTLPVPAWVTRDDGTRLGSTWVYGQLEGKARAKKIAWWKSDAREWHWSNKWIRSDVQQTYRAQARMELKRFEKNEEYEVIIPRKNLLPWD